MRERRAAADGEPVRRSGEYAATDPVLGGLRGDVGDGFVRPHRFGAQVAVAGDVGLRHRAGPATIRVAGSRPGRRRMRSRSPGDGCGTVGDPSVGCRAGRALGRQTSRRRTARGSCHRPARVSRRAPAREPWWRSSSPAARDHQFVDDARLVLEREPPVRLGPDDIGCRQQVARVGGDRVAAHIARRSWLAARHPADQRLPRIDLPVRVGEVE